MKKYDVIIVGCGPAGIAAAKSLEKSNLTFCVIEKNKFPRFKLCGGGLTSKSQRALKRINISIDDIDTYECSKVRIVSKKVSKEVELDNKLIMVDRNEFDHNNSKQIDVKNLFQGENILKIEKNILTTDKETYEFKYIIFADGINGYSRKLIENREFGFCVEYDVPEKSENAIIDFSAVDLGYGWIFPKKNTTTIGLGNLNTKKSDYINLLVKFGQKYGFEIDKTKIKGYHIPVFSKNIYNSSVIDNKFILVGDAASLVDPITGEGIYYAITSGMYAAESIITKENSKKELSEIYFEKTTNLCNSLEKRLKASRLLYSRLGNGLIEMGLNNKQMLSKLNRAFG